MEVRYSVSPQETKAMDTEQLRDAYLIPAMFVAGSLQLVYTHVDRFIIGGAVPLNEPLLLEAERKDMGADFFLERREIGIVNVGSRGTVTVDGASFILESKDCLYVGRGVKEVLFQSESAEQPARFYFNSTPAHQTYPTVQVAIRDAEPQHLGSNATSNERTIYKYIHENGIQSCQLVMGMTLLKPNNMWNTMPCHMHNRRSEIYFYFDMQDDSAVFHFMGEPQETRHLMVHNEQAVISPSWSVHSGVGTSAYTFIWGMAGENQTFADMDPVAIKDLR